MGQENIEKPEMEKPETEKPQRPLIKLLIELGPIALFFYLYDAKDMETVYTAVGGFMAAMVVSLIASKMLLKEISLMLWISCGLVMILGGLTIYFHNELFIKIKPTILYSLFAVTLLGGVAFNKPFIKNVMEAGFPPMAHSDWMKLSRNFGLYFVGCAILNEYIWRNFDFETWIATKIWVFVPLSFVMMLTQMPTLMKYMQDEPPKGDD